MGVALSRWETECAVSRNKTNVNYSNAIVGAGSHRCFLANLLGCAGLRVLIDTVPAHDFALMARALGIEARLVPANR